MTEIYYYYHQITIIVDWLNRTMFPPFPQYKHITSLTVSMGDGVLLLIRLIIKNNQIH